MYRNRRRYGAGFTLVELMVTIGVVAIGTAIAYPSFSNVIQSNRIAGGTNTLIAAVNLARTEAIRSTRGGGVCPSDDGDRCSGSDWNAGMLVFTDRDGSGKWSGGDKPIRYFEADSALNMVASPPSGASTAISEIVFDARGRARAESRVVIRPDKCKKGAPLRREISISAVGQVRAIKADCQ